MLSNRIDLAVVHVSESCACLLRWDISARQGLEGLPPPVRQIGHLSAMLVIPGSAASAPVYPPTPQSRHRGGVREAAH